MERLGASLARHLRLEVEVRLFELGDLTPPDRVVLSRLGLRSFLDLLVEILLRLSQLARADRRSEHRVGQGFERVRRALDRVFELLLRALELHGVIGQVIGLVAGVIHRGAHVMERLPSRGAALLARSQRIVRSLLGVGQAIGPGFVGALAEDEGRHLPPDGVDLVAVQAEPPLGLGLEFIGRLLS